MNLTIIATLVVVTAQLLAASARADLVYTFLPDPGLPDGYGFAGSITTDGTLGDFTVASDVPIIDWSITIFTPSDIDGVAEQTLTPANSELTVFVDPGTHMTFTATQVYFPDFQPTGIVGLAFQTPSSASSQEELFFAGAQDGGGGYIRMEDFGETPSIAFYDYPNPGGRVIAAVPEPSPVLLMLGVLALACVKYGLVATGVYPAFMPLDRRGKSALRLD